LVSRKVSDAYGDTHAIFTVRKIVDKPVSGGKLAIPLTSVIST